ncbi:MAG: DUF308 domain-containing protein [Patescibacteria group bacterium]|jgi:uncharacterized membrane protein HdeD (DUF308 family)
MENSIFQKWWLLFLEGFFLALLGVLVLAWPMATLQIIVTLVGVYAFVVGVINIIKGVRLIGKSWESLALFIIGILAILLGILIFEYPGLYLATSIILVGIWFIIRGVYDIVAYSPFKAISVISGILGIIVGVLLLNKPIINGTALFWVLGLYALIVGAIYMGLSLKIRSLINE